MGTPFSCVDEDLRRSRPEGRAKTIPGMSGVPGAGWSRSQSRSRRGIFASTCSEEAIPCRAISSSMISRSPTRLAPVTPVIVRRGDEGPRDSWRMPMLRQPVVARTASRAAQRIRVTGATSRRPRGPGPARPRRQVTARRGLDEKVRDEFPLLGNEIDAERGAQTIERVALELHAQTGARVELNPPPAAALERVCGPLVHPAELPGVLIADRPADRRLVGVALVIRVEELPRDAEGIAARYTDCEARLLRHAGGSAGDDSRDERGDGQEENPEGGPCPEPRHVVIPSLGRRQPADEFDRQNGRICDGGKRHED